MPEKRYRFVPPGGGPNYDWTRDHTFVKVAASDTGGAYALMEDNPSANLRSGCICIVSTPRRFTFSTVSSSFTLMAIGSRLNRVHVCIFRPVYRMRSLCRPAASRAA